MNFKEFKTKCHESKLEKMSGDRFYKIERNISIRITWLLVKLFPRIKPNYVTCFSLLLLFIIFFSNFFKLNKELDFLITIFQLLFLYFIGILDKIDGEVARFKDYCTQKGIYYDHTVHFFYPFVFYFSISYFFYFINNSEFIFFVAILLGLLTTNLLFFNEAISFIGNKIKDNKIKINDVIHGERKKTRPARIFRIIDYMTFMIYTYVLFYYFLLIFISLYNFQLAYTLFNLQIFISLFVISYKIFYFYPHKRMFNDNFFKNN